MKQLVRCSQCKSRYSLASEVDLTSVRCPQCQGAFAPASSSGSVLGGALATCVVVVVVGLGGKMLWSRSDSPNTGRAAAQTTEPVDVPRNAKVAPRVPNAGVAASASPSLENRAAALTPWDQAPVEKTPSPAEGAERPATEPAHTASAPKLPPGVALLNVTRDVTGDRMQTASGFIVVQSDLLATSFNAVEGAIYVEAEFADGLRANVAGFRAVDPQRNLAILALEGSAKIQPLKLGGRPTVGARIWAAQPDANSSSEGEVLRLIAGSQTPGPLGIDRKYLDLEPRSSWIRTTALLEPSQAGGPLLNAAGEVIGVNAWQHPEAAESLACSVEHLSGLISHLGAIRPLTALPKGPRKRSDDERLADAKAREDARLKAAIEAKLLLDEAERGKIAAQARKDRIARALQDLAKARQNESSLAAQLVALDAAGTELEKRLSEVNIEGQSVETRGLGYKQQITFNRNRQGVLSQQILDLDALSLRKGAPDNSVLRLQLSAELTMLQSALPALIAESAQLEATYIRLDREARDLRAKIEAKTKERRDLVAAQQKAASERGRLEHELVELGATVPDPAKPVEPIPSLSGPSKFGR